jgi:hypothetical protein
MRRQPVQPIGPPYYIAPAELQQFFDPPPRREAESASIAELGSRHVARKLGN